MTNRKMTGTQPVVGGFDLDAFVEQSESAPAAPAKKAPARKPQLTERVQIKLTPSEMTTLKEKAGMAPISAFVRKHLQDTGLI